MCIDDNNWSKVCKSGTVNISRRMIWIQSKKGAVHFKHEVPTWGLSGFAKCKDDDEKLWCQWKVKDDLLSVCLLHILIILRSIQCDVVISMVHILRIQGHQDFWCYVGFKTKDELDAFCHRFARIATASKS